MDDWSSFPLADTNQLHRLYEPELLRKAMPLSTRFTFLHWGHGYINGILNDASDRQVDVGAIITQFGGKVNIQADCSCNSQSPCAHVPALMIAAIDKKSPEQVRPLPEPPEKLSAQLTFWLQQFRHGATAPAIVDPPTKQSVRIAYVLSWSNYAGCYRVDFNKAKVAADGSLRSLGDEWRNIEGALANPPKFIPNSDLGILRLLWAQRSRNTSSLEIRGSAGEHVFEMIVGTGRLVLEKNGQTTFFPKLGANRPGTVNLHADGSDKLAPVLTTDPASTEILPLASYWYADSRTQEVGKIDLPCDKQVVDNYLAMPAVSCAEAITVTQAIASIVPELPTQAIKALEDIEEIDGLPLPTLILDSLPVYPKERSAYSYRYEPNETLDFATVRFDYAGCRVDPHHPNTLFNAANGLQRVIRKIDLEKRYLQELHATGLRQVPQEQARGPEKFPPAIMRLAHSDAWPDFMQNKLPDLRASAWQVEMADTFRHSVYQIDLIDGSLHPTDDGWFGLEMGVVVANRTVQLAPLLRELFQRDGRWLTPGMLEQIGEEEWVELRTDRGERLRLSAARLKPVVRVLIDLFEGMGSGQGNLRVSRFDVGRLDALDKARWKFHGDAAFRELALALRDGQGVTEVPVPVGLVGELRGYQRQGLSWMQFLLRHKLAGVLADDMGLGKTVQTLAHILLEKENGRLDRPVLIVMPTSLVNNWREETQRFAPNLTVLSMHGPQRKEQFARIPQHDVVLTTYALVWRDREELSKHSFHLLVLDEAQFVKNTNTKAAATIRSLDARHRLCLSGTPLENHLGELWSLFDFLLPGFLGGEKDFNKRWRSPIEKSHDEVRRTLLARRVRPFIMRRRKDDVAKELPPKTTIIRTVDLEGAQRDLYESVRVTMQKQVQEAIAGQGLQRSHILVFDAMLKLRQVCCDPRLVKISKAITGVESAKLELLMTMLPELIEEGRRILLFSQFTSMLALIEPALQQAGIEYVTITGDTVDRVKPVHRFQRGEVPVFLISLKAGGTGLNLTAADTVIFYDPWWNPAAENQAAARAHRIGQDKPVFVYKLIVAGSIEEKIVRLQETKSALVEGILSNDGSAGAKFSEQDINALFSPIPDVV